MRKAILLLLSCSMLTSLIAQPLNDDCSNALSLPLKTPSPCPVSDEASDTFYYTNTGATASSPFPALAGCSGEAPDSGADVWFRFSPRGNSITIALAEGLETPFVALFESDSESCSGMYPVACASGEGSLELSTYVDPTRFYFLLVSGGASLEMIGKLLGHSQTQTTLRYAHLMDSPLRAGVDAVASAFRPKPRLVHDAGDRGGKKTA